MKPKGVVESRQTLWRGVSQGLGMRIGKTQSLILLMNNNKLGIDSSLQCWSPPPTSAIQWEDWIVLILMNII